MFIYKITNKINNKIYIGQVYNKSIEDRFKRHIKSASPSVNSYIDRAIYKYGADNFIVEQIDTAKSLKELNEKEKYWIKFYNSIDRNIGYNLTFGGDGGNTYINKTPEEMKEIKKKISIANSGKNNGISKQIKAKNIKTNEIYHFDTLTETLNFLGIKHKESVMDICNKKYKFYFKNIWNFAYENEDFEELEIKIPRDHFGSRKCVLINKLTNEKTQHKSVAEARRMTNLKSRAFENDEWKIIETI